MKNKWNKNALSYGTDSKKIDDPWNKNAMKYGLEESKPVNKSELTKNTPQNNHWNKTALDYGIKEEENVTEDLKLLPIIIKKINNL